MDPVDVVDLTRRLVDIDSTTDREADAGRFLARFLAERGYRVQEQPVDGRRANIWATRGSTPDVVLSTHYDCVPPFFVSTQRDGAIYGRGACDAKGILAAQVAAAEELAAQGIERVGLLFVVGEERGSDGALAANALAPGNRFLVNGEPTDNRLATSSRGAFRVRLHAAGRAAHSAYPERGESAIEKLIDALVMLRGLEWPEDADAGRTSYSVGLLSGGVAPNVVPPSASAEVVFRTVGPTATLRERLRELARLVSIEEVIDVPFVQLATVPGFETEAFRFTTDIPLLTAWGTPLLLGPGSIHVAHTDAEHVRIDHLHAAVRLYVKLARQLLGSPARDAC
ncbi:MAG: M20/M25/M40 family metallo-hydrolase [Bacteroidales bacterium]